MALESAGKALKQPAHHAVQRFSSAGPALLQPPWGLVH